MIGSEYTSAIILTIVGLVLALLSVWLDNKGKDGSGWAIIAVLFLITSCTELP